MRTNARALLVFLAVLLGSLGCDHATKRLAIATLSHSGSVSIAGDTLQLELASNRGAFLSLGAGLPDGARELIFIGLPPSLLLFLVCLFLRRGGSASLPLVVGLGLVAGGGLANWVDRLLHDGAVTDFLVLCLGPLRTGIFNVADLAVVAGVALLLFAQRRDLPTPVPPA